MAKLDQEDINFLEDLAEELRRIGPVYNAEADELENILFRLTGLDSEERAMDAANDYAFEIAAEAIGELSATDICDLFLQIDLDDLQKLEMIESLIESVNTNGHTDKLVEETE